MKTRLAVLETLHSGLNVTDVETPALSFGQVLVRVRASGICGAQLQEIEGKKGNAKYLPHAMGHEGCGLVEDVGPGVSHVRPGQRVVMHWRKGDGLEGGLIRYPRDKGCSVGAGPIATLGTHVVVSENRLTAVPDDVPDELCALLGCSLSTALGTIEQEAHVLMGETVLIIGCGGLGLNLIMAARLAQASTVHVVERIGSKRELALAMGAHEFIEPARLGDVRGGYDVVIDTSGSVSALEWGYQRLGDCGRFIMVGQPDPGESVRLLEARHLFQGEGKWIKATQGGGFQPSADIPRYVALWRSGALNLAAIISHRLPLERVNEGIDLVRQGHAGRVLIEMT